MFNQACIEKYGQEQIDLISKKFLNVDIDAYYQVFVNIKGDESHATLTGVYISDVYSPKFPEGTSVLQNMNYIFFFYDEIYFRTIEYADFINEYRSIKIESILVKSRYI